jgi:hypothetical protein
MLLRSQLSRFVTRGKSRRKWVMPASTGSFGRRHSHLMQLTAMAFPIAVGSCAHLILRLALRCLAAGDGAEARRGCNCNMHQSMCCATTTRATREEGPPYPTCLCHRYRFPWASLSVSAMMSVICLPHASVLMCRTHAVSGLGPSNLTITMVLVAQISPTNALMIISRLCPRSATRFRLNRAFPLVVAPHNVIHTLL